MYIWSTKVRVFLDYLSDCGLQENSAPWSYIHNSESYSASILLREDACGMWASAVCETTQLVLMKGGAESRHMYLLFILEFQNTLNEVSILVVFLQSYFLASTFCHRDVPLPK
jgi:hypothetical protein